MEVSHIMFALLRFEINRTELCDEVKNLITPEALPALFKLSKKHDLAHLVGDALDKNGLLPDGSEAKKRFLQERTMAVYRYEQLQYELDEICAVLEEAKIPFLPLKGSVIRGYYPEPWMRTSCDIDILVKEEVLETAAKYLCEKLEYERGDFSSHDISLNAPSGVHLELHYNLIEEYISVENEKVLERAWDILSNKKDAPYCREMSDELFYFYHIAHAAKHFKNGGCGVRPFLDDWILNNKAKGFIELRKELLRDGKLMGFAEAFQALSECWFSNKESDDLMKEMESYILYGGVYGNMENQVAVQQVKNGSKFRYLLSRIFLSHDLIITQYPILKKHKWLMPFCQVCRWGRLIFKGGARNAKYELTVSANISKDKKDTVEGLLQSLELL